jgi:4-amino-4-deoxy-L-arabinose transferase-like glycosyltransferase
MARVRIRFTTIHRHEWVSLALFTLGLLVAFLTQRVIYANGASLAAALVYFSACLFLLAAYGRTGASFAIPIRLPLRAANAAQPANPARWLFVFPAFVFGLIAFFEARANEFTLLGVSAWVTSLVLFCIAFWEGSPFEPWRSARAKFSVLTRHNHRGQRARWLLAALLGIIALGMFFYFYRLDAIPAEMTSDHAEKILDTYDILRGKFSVFFERNTGREPLQFYANALVVLLGLAPLDMLALKIVGACAGVLTIPAVFLLAREMFDDEVSLLAAFLFAVSIFPLALARIGLRYPLSPLFVAWTLFFLLRALRRQSRNDYLIAGVLLGIGLNGYSPFRVVVGLVLAWLGLWRVYDFNVTVNGIRRFAANAVLLFSAALLVFTPLLGYISIRPDLFAYRMATRLTSLEAPVQGNPLEIFLDNNLRAFGMFNVRGDVVWVNSLPNVPVVDFLLGACLFAGALYAAYRLIRFREYPFALILVAVFVLLLPSTLTFAFPEENPSVVRAGGVAPFVMILAALPLAWGRKLFACAGSEILGAFLVGSVLVGILLTNFNLYFVKYDDQYRHAAWNSSEIADALRDFAVRQKDWEHIYVVSAPHWVDYRAVGIHLGSFDFRKHLIENEQQFVEQARDPAPKLYALKNQDSESLALLQRLYPNGVPVRVDSKTPGRDFVAFFTQLP